MGTYKTIRIIFCISVLTLFVSCGGNTEAIYAENEELKEENKELRNENNSNLKKSIEQMKTLNNIVAQLEDISGKTLLIRHNIELGNIDLLQAEKANAYLASIKKELDKVRQGDFTKEQLAIISNLQSIIEIKEKEIVQLKEELNRKNAELRRNKEVIAEQESTIQQQSRKIHEQQALKWHEMGILLYNVSLSYEEGSKGFLGLNKDNYNKMKNNKKLLLIESKKCFEESIKMGIVSSMQYLTKINEELSNI
jgi:hypothetical protein